MDHFARFLSDKWTVAEGIARIEQRIWGTTPTPSYDNEPVLFVHSSGTNNPSRATGLSLNALEEEAEIMALLIAANKLEGRAWHLVQSPEQAEKNMLRLGKLGISASSWLSTWQSAPTMIPVPDFELAGLHRPKPAFCTASAVLNLLGDPNNVVDMIPWRQDAIGAKATIRSGGEPLPPNYNVVGRYSMSEVGPIALSCPVWPENYHLLHYRVGFQHGKVTPLSLGARVTATEQTDIFDYVENDCGCLLSSIGLNRQITNIRRRP